MCNVTLDIGLYAVGVRRSAFVRYVMTKFSRMDSLPNFLMVLRCAHFAGESSANISRPIIFDQKKQARHMVIGVPRYC